MTEEFNSVVCDFPLHELRGKVASCPTMSPRSRILTLILCSLWGLSSFHEQPRFLLHFPFNQRRAGIKHHNLGFFESTSQEAHM